MLTYSISPKYAITLYLWNRHQWLCPAKGYTKKKIKSLNWINQCDQSLTVSCTSAYLLNRTWNFKIKPMHNFVYVGILNVIGLSFSFRTAKMNNILTNLAVTCYGFTYLWNRILPNWNYNYVLNLDHFT